jgi:hypothetical protein
VYGFPDDFQMNREKSFFVGFEGNMFVKKVMNWEVVLSAAVPVLTGVALMLYKMGSIDTKLVSCRRR